MLTIISEAVSIPHAVTVCLLFAVSLPSIAQLSSYERKDPRVTSQVRMRWQEFDQGPAGQARLASLLKGIRKMKSLDSSPKGSVDYRRSWQYWANIHGYYGSDSRDGTVEEQLKYLRDGGLEQYLSFYTSIHNQVAPDQIARTVWAKCQHSEYDPSGKLVQAVNFFAWHRMYLYYFERVLRWAADDETLRLPYWDYTNPEQLKLPPEFRKADSPLYDKLRDANMNKGSVALDPNATNVDKLLREQDFFTFEVNVEFINHSIHGFIHCTIGPNCPVANMGDVPVAANDPVFYSHHANIDRLWACWQKLHPTPGGSWQDQQFSFINESGSLETKPVRDFLDPGPLGYVYDNVDNCAREPRAMQISQAANPANVKAISLGKTDRAVPVNKPTITTYISLTQAALISAGSVGRIDLLLGDVTAKSPPGVMFNVYVADGAANANSRKYAGTVSWFGVFHHHGNTSAVKRNIRFDVTEQLRALRNLRNNRLSIIIEATLGRVPAERGPSLNSLREAADRAFRRQADVRIGVIQLVATQLDARKNL